MKILPAFGLLLLSGLFLFARADETDSELNAANQAYQQGHYEDSARLFNHLVETDGYSAPLLLDAGNAELKAGHLARALLDYERARYLAPSDAGINNNLQLARHEAGLDPDPYRWWQIVIRTINWMAWLAVILICLALIFLALVGLAMVKTGNAQSGPFPSGWRKFFQAILFICIPMGLFFGFVELSTIGFGDRIEGVIMAKEATLRLSPFEGAARTGSLPEGELVTVEKRHNDYLWIDDRSRQSGWVNEKELEPVVPGSLDAGK